MIEVIISISSLFIGIISGFFLRRYIGEAKIVSAEKEAKKIISGAEKESENIEKEALLKAKDEIYSLRTVAEKEVREMRNEVQKQEQRLMHKEENIENKSIIIDKKENELTEKSKDIERLKSQHEKVLEQEKELLQSISNMSADEAKEILLERVKEDIRLDAAKLIKEIEGKAKEDGEKKARNIIALAIQRCASDHSAETTVSVVPLPSDEMKGRIIGREGRNIRAFENLTGINLIIDDTPEAVILSSFDPVRREIARRALEKLISDGRIHPARIEEMFEKSKEEVEIQIREMGEQAVFEIGLTGLNAELVRALGRLKYRTSYGQNVLLHSLEVARLAGIMASELGVDVRLAKRAGLLHDIGKAIDHEVEGPHAIIGAELAKRLKETKEVKHIIESHHGEVEPRTVEAVLVQAADAISASRPGARRETMESYIKRLEKLEELAESQKGVEKCYVMQAGREIRVMVKPEQIGDEESSFMAREIAKQIEEELEYPGQIRVMVIRETRTIEYAK
ncbi:MAG: ribonuclease Y [Actinomycetia bacterium]|nr:ribonuclease Y [Actinomycetes bacterium]